VRNELTQSSIWLGKTIWSRKTKKWLAIVGAFLTSAFCPPPNANLEKHLAIAQTLERFSTPGNGVGRIDVDGKELR